MSAGSTRILIDAGLSAKEAERRLNLIGESLENIDGILVTHEHSDHISGLERIARRVNIKRAASGRSSAVYLTALTARSIEWTVKAPPTETFQAGSRFPVGCLEVESFSIPHDAVDPVGFSILAEGIKISIATDLGYVTDSIRYHLRNAHALVLESNHDIEMLKVGPYPWPVKQRVMSRVGHLSNNSACDFLEADFDGTAQVLILGHLSEQNNHPEIVRLSADQVLTKRGLSPKLQIATQNEPGEVLVV